MSLPRFVAVLFPLFMWLAIVCDERRITDLVAAGFARRPRPVHGAVRELALDLVSAGPSGAAGRARHARRAPAAGAAPAAAAGRGRLRGERGAGRRRLRGRDRVLPRPPPGGVRPRAARAPARPLCRGDAAGARAARTSTTRPRAGRCWRRSSSGPIRTCCPRSASCASAGLTLVVASNWDCSLPDWLGPPGITELVDGVVTSAEVGAPKPRPAGLRAGARDRGRGAVGGAPRGRQGRQRRGGRRGGRRAGRSACSARASHRPAWRPSARFGSCPPYSDWSVEQRLDRSNAAAARAPGASRGRRRRAGRRGTPGSASSSR